MRVQLWRDRLTPVVGGVKDGRPACRAGGFRRLRHGLDLAVREQRRSRARATRPAGPAGVRLAAFPTQADAESWVGEVWRELLEPGVDQVSLFDGPVLVYGPMSLHPA